MGTCFAVDIDSVSPGLNELLKGFSACNMRYIYRRTYFSSQVCRPSDSFRFRKRRPGNIMIFGSRLTFFDTFSPEKIQYFTVFRMYKYRGANFSCPFKDPVIRTVVNMKRGTVICHEYLYTGYSLFRKFIYFIKNIICQICYHGMQGIIHAAFALCPDIDTVIDRIQQSSIRVLRREIYYGRSPSDYCRVRSFITGSIFVANIAQS